MHFDGLIFDLDGTLWDCSKACAEGFNLAYEEFGIERKVTAQFIKSISGKPSAEFFEILISGVPDSIREEVSRCLDQHEIAEIERRAPFALYNGVSEGLYALGRTYSLYVVSNCGERYLKTFNQCARIGHLFLDTECFGRTLQLKAANIRALIERQKPKAACYIGDTAGDEDASEKAGIPFFHAKYGFGKPAGEPHAFESFGALTNYFMNLAGAGGIKT